jgi:hypothetical protein
MAGATELECGASVTGQRSNQLNYAPNRGINNLHRKQDVALGAGFGLICELVPFVPVDGVGGRNALRTQALFKYLLFRSPPPLQTYAIDINNLT